MTTPILNEQESHPDQLTRSSRLSGMTFNIVKINNYFKIYRESANLLQKIHNLIYAGQQFEVEYMDVEDIPYYILNENIVNEYNFIKREFTDETMDDVAKYIKMLGESMSFFRDIESESHYMNKNCVFDVKDDSLYESLRIGSGTRKISDMKPEDFLTRPDIKSIEKEYSRLDKELVDKIWENMEGKADKEPASIRGMDYDLSNLCPYSSDYGSAEFNEQIQGVTVHENISRSELTASHKVLYNRHFFNAILVDKFTYDLLFSSDHTKKLMPEIEVISELYLKDDAELNDFSQLIAHEIFYSADDLRKIVNFYLSKNNTECPSITAIRKYINANFTLDSDIANRIQFKVLFDDICAGMNINPKYHEAIKRSLPLLLTELGLAKKRYSEGIFWYGLKKMSRLLGTSESGKNLNLLTSEIVKLREEQDAETSKIMDYVFDSQIPKKDVSNTQNQNQVKLKKPNRNANCQLRYDPVIPPMDNNVHVR
jgi:hypothetical protein